MDTSLNDETTDPLANDDPATDDRTTDEFATDHPATATLRVRAGRGVS